MSESGRMSENELRCRGACWSLGSRDIRLPAMLGRLPRQAAWRHVGARDGFEVTFAALINGELCFTGTTSAVEDARAWTVSYEIRVDPSSWATRSAHVSARSLSGQRALEVKTDGAGSWRVDGRPAPHLDGCLDIDLESSVLTNAFPAHRLGLAPGRGADAPAAYVREQDLRVERLEQSYFRLENEVPRGRFSYTAPGFDFACELAYDDAGLLLDYPGIAVRAA
jgi:hypothetical protein